MTMMLFPIAVLVSTVLTMAACEVNGLSSFTAMDEFTSIGPSALNTDSMVEKNTRCNIMLGSKQVNGVLQDVQLTSRDKLKLAISCQPTRQVPVKVEGGGFEHTDQPV